ncbi:hypothetical protein PKB_1135 [Pseudomonas knackmussii B13]|uniref:Uncharacterized protein n=1 Tax=Pseudomonas knackmussii (strain DSM 6978 / CCUG 54928 / LMG 23759 / B13) TaxID=1301098 RepID=A0A024HBR7_PSEKB|nr:hypothetical protein [Pseudomonas knackmussii]CDF82500.1 hypothetical protein PKB_1135 [Pseudomonas knackmussii B13]
MNKPHPLTQVIRCRHLVWGAAISVALLSPTVWSNELDPAHLEEAGRINLCSKSFCERFEPLSTKTLRIDQASDVGIEVHTTRVLPFHVGSYLNPGGFTCHFVVLFSSTHGLYTPNNKDIWQSFNPRKKSEFLSSAKGEDRSYLAGQGIKSNYIHSYLKISGYRKGKSFSKIDSMSARSLAREAIPGISMAEIETPCSPGDIVAGDKVSLYIPKPGAYPKGPDKSRGDLYSGSFTEFSLPEAYSQKFHRLFETNDSTPNKATLNPTK